MDVWHVDLLPLFGRVHPHPTGVIQEIRRMLTAVNAPSVTFGPRTL
jgi:hypothetical protein